MRCNGHDGGGGSSGGGSDDGIGLDNSTERTSNGLIACFKPFRFDENDIKIK